LNSLHLKQYLICLLKVTNNYYFKLNSSKVIINFNYFNLFFDVINFHHLILFEITFNLIHQYFVVISYLNFIKIIIRLFLNIFIFYS